MAWMIESGAFVIDFGQELTGWLEFTVPQGVPGEVSVSIYLGVGCLCIACRGVAWRGVA